MGVSPHRIIWTVAVAAALAGCGKPTDILLGPEPLKQMADQGDKFKQLPEEERKLLVAYLTSAELKKLFGPDRPHPATGRTVGEVLTDARKWEADMKVEAEAAKKRQAEAEALRAKVEAERKAAMVRLQEVVTLAITNKRVLPKNYDVSRFNEMLALDYAIENKSDKTIRQLKGTLRFYDATGDEIGDLPINIERTIAPGGTYRGDTGRGWTINEFRKSDIERIAMASFNGMKTVFEPEAISFSNGEVLRTPE
jgi:Sec-independent protein translocase protein TatA